MNGQRLVPLLLIVCSLFVLGTMAASLDATVTSSPRDGIDVDTDSLPFVGDGVSDVVVSYEQGNDGERTGAARSQDDTAGSIGGEAEQAEDVGGSGAAQPPADASAGEGSSSAEAGSDGSQRGDRGNAGQMEGAGAGSEGGATDQSRSLLEWLVLVGLVVLALLAVVAAALYVIRRRERLVSLLRRLAERYGLVSGAHPVPEAVPVDDGDAVTVVERAWAEMLRRSDARCAASDTPRECAAAAIETGVDREPVEELTSLYERVRYGTYAVTPDHASRALGLLREVSHRHGRRQA